MNIKELIEILKKYPLNTEVLTADTHDSDFYAPTTIYCVNYKNKKIILNDN